jgi:hypothetical protein
MLITSKVARADCREPTCQLTHASHLTVHAHALLFAVFSSCFLRCRTTANLSNHTPLHIYRSPPKPLHSTFRTPLPAETTPLYIYHSTLLRNHSTPVRNHSTLLFALHSPPKSLDSPLGLGLTLTLTLTLTRSGFGGEWSDFGGEWSDKCRVE